MYTSNAKMADKWWAFLALTSSASITTACIYDYLSSSPAHSIVGWLTIFTFLEATRSCMWTQDFSTCNPRCHWPVCYSQVEETKVRVIHWTVSLHCGVPLITQPKEEVLDPSNNFFGFHFSSIGNNLKVAKIAAWDPWLLVWFSLNL